MTIFESPKFSHLVLDSGPIIHNNIPSNLSANYYTVPEVLEEIKDKATRERLQTLPYTLNTRKASPAALRQVVEFAKVSGDLASLSAVDLKVIALALELEQEFNAKDSAVLKTPAEEKIHDGSATASSGHKKRENGQNKLLDNNNNNNADNSSAGSRSSDDNNNSNDNNNNDNNNDDDDKDSNDSNKVAQHNDRPKNITKVPQTRKNKDQNPKAASLAKDDEDYGEWITPENISKFKNTQESGPEPAMVKDTLSATSVACITTDFAMQNLLLRMKLKLYSPEGYRIKQIKNWLLRCHACYRTTLQLASQFCDHCGGATLTRCSYKIDASGRKHLFLSKNFQYNLRGSRTPLPLPKPGRLGNQILLRADQKEYHQALKNHQRHEKKAMKVDMHALDDRLANLFEGMNIKSATGYSPDTKPVIGFGRRNPNQNRRRK